LEIGKRGTCATKRGGKTTHFAYHKGRNFGPTMGRGRSFSKWGERGTEKKRVAGQEEGRGRERRKMRSSEGGGGGTRRTWEAKAKGGESKEEEKILSV